MGQALMHRECCLGTVVPSSFNTVSEELLSGVLGHLGPVESWDERSLRSC